MKLSEIEIKTKRVYINRIVGTDVKTETLSKEVAIEKYGNYPILETSEKTKNITVVIIQ